MSKRLLTTRLLTLTFVASAFAATAGLAAQAPRASGQKAQVPTGAASTPAQDPQVPTGAPSIPPPSARVVTLSGCIARQAESLSASLNPHFTLTTAAAADAGKPVGTSGTSTPALTTVARTYRLDAADSMIAPHLGHRVEITGTVEEPPAQVKGTTSAATAPVVLPKLKAQSVKMVAATCR